MHKPTVFASLLLSATLAGQSAAQPQARGQPGGLHDDFHELLAATVEDERIDYLTVRDEHFKALAGYLDRLARVELKALSRDEQLATLINLYNATMIKVVAERYRPGWTPALNEFAIFDEKFVRLAGNEISLNHLEHQIIRKDYAEPRIHVALVCAARSCPPLLPRAYRGDDLDTVLEAKMRAFVRDTSRNRIGASKVELSKIFEWYRSDFGETERELLRYLSQYAGQDLTGHEVEYLEYSWQPNILAPPGEWVVARDRELPVKVLRREGSTLTVRKPFGRGEAEISARRARPLRIEN